MKSTDPLISIVVPNYNGGIFLEQTLLSIFQQSFADFEVIVVDGGSVDLSLAICERYMGRFSYFRSRHDDGQYEAINEGFAQARGRIFAWLNSDDLLHPGALRCMAKTFYDANTYHSLYTGLPSLFDASGRLVRVHQNVFGWSHKYFMSVDPFGPAHYMQQESTFFTRDLWEKVGGLHANNFSIAADFDLWLRMSEYTEILEINRLVGGFRQHENNRSHARDQYAREVKQSQANQRSKNSKCTAHGHFQSLDTGEYRYSTADPDLCSIKLFTSLAPKNIKVQQDAIATWLDNGFDVVALNAHAEKEILAASFSEIKFKEPTNTLEAMYGKPYVSINDLITNCAETSGISGIINSDIRFLTQKSFESILADSIISSNESTNSLFIFSRLELGSYASQVSANLAERGLQPVVHGDVYCYGFDLMIACQATWRKLLAAMNDEDCLGMGVPWWDYFIPMLSLMNGIPIRVANPTPIGHLYHEAVYSKEIWIKSARSLLELVHRNNSTYYNKTINELTANSCYLENLARQVAKTIHVNSCEVNLGQYILPGPLEKTSEKCLDHLHLAFLTPEIFSRARFGNYRAP